MMNDKSPADPLPDCPPSLSPRVAGSINFRASGPHLTTAGALTGTRVANRDDQTLGTISDLIVDLERGCIAYAVMASGGFMGVGERLFALDWKALTLNSERQCYILDVPPATFENEPGFERSGWPESPFKPREG